MARTEIITCDRCGNQATKWQGPFLDGAIVLVKEWYVEYSLATGEPYHKSNPLQKDLCGECNKELRAFLNSKKEEP